MLSGRTALLIGTTLSTLCVSSAWSQEDHGYYISASLGGTNPFIGPRQNVYVLDTTQPLTSDQEMELVFPSTMHNKFDGDGLNFGNFTNLAAGYRFSSRFRIEAEVSYLQNDTATYRAFSIASDDPNREDEDKDARDRYYTPPGNDLDSIFSSGYGKVETKATFANGFLDLPIKESRWVPYVGAGIGIAEVDVDFRPGGVDLVNMDETVFAYQAIVGMAYEFKSDTDLTLGARYRGMSDVSVNTEYLPPAFSVENEGLVGEVGLRLGF
ncbi:outer membrane protein [Parvularcula sp. LCG005]|uniref:outer membrane protein n=1 Tax=Parvularcula sp. LCG005 TaxID=3078805 RepID=UPI0029438119|nr:outer membrane beta-barrel protein [Parvularcula sp. LCG005]WOI53210.1 outer membrane beta-barrel protein [Parvularcula sp. LCG005]